VLNGGLFQIIDKTIEHFGKINILVNNAAEQHTIERFEDIDPEQVERVFRTNIFSHFYLTKYV
jgi:NAD(P)-dependent dehydrogenase (short-subunit alcohol dehydrogenase family)